MDMTNLQNTINIFFSIGLCIFCFLITFNTFTKIEKSKENIEDFIGIINFDKYFVSYSCPKCGTCIDIKKRKPCPQCGLILYKEKTKKYSIKP